MNTTSVLAAWPHSTLWRCSWNQECWSGGLGRRQWFRWSVVIVTIRPSGGQIAQCPNPSHNDGVSYKIYIYLPFHDIRTSTPPTSSYSRHSTVSATASPLRGSNWCVNQFQMSPVVAACTFLNPRWSDCPANQNVNARTTQFCSVEAKKLELTIPQPFRDVTPTFGQFQHRLKTSLFRLAYGRDLTAHSWQSRLLEQRNINVRTELNSWWLNMCSQLLTVFQTDLVMVPSPVSCNWRRGSVVRTSVCSWRTFPDLRLIHGWRVTTSWVRRLLWVNQLGQLSLPPVRGR